MIPLLYTPFSYFLSRLLSLFSRTPRHRFEVEVGGRVIAWDGSPRKRQVIYIQRLK